MGAEQVTMPDGIVNEPDRVLPRNDVFKVYKISFRANRKQYFTAIYKSINMPLIPFMFFPDPGKAA